jgi:hypothetical protein
MRRFLAYKEIAYRNENGCECELMCMQYKIHEAKS